jgi:Fe2+ or Zn2+ uptake regulation protein
MTLTATVSSGAFPLKEALRIAGFKCAKCDKPLLVLDQSEEKKVLYCSHCGKTAEIKPEEASMILQAAAGNKTTAINSHLIIRGR